jgi:regulatory protein
MTHAPSTLLAYCLRLLARREHSQQELQQKCLAKGFTRAAIAPVLLDLVAQNWQSDVRYAESYSRTRLEKGYGVAAVRYELQQRGISPAIIDDTLHTLNPDGLAILARVYLKKYPAEPLITRNEWAKRSRFLLQRGFTPDLITALRRHLAIKLL